MLGFNDDLKQTLRLRNLNSWFVETFPVLHQVHPCYRSDFAIHPLRYWHDPKPPQKKFKKGRKEDSQHTSHSIDICYLVSHSLILSHELIETSLVSWHDKVLSAAAVLCVTSLSTFFGEQRKVVFFLLDYSYFIVNVAGDRKLNSSFIMNGASRAFLSHRFSFSLFFSPFPVFLPVRVSLCVSPPTAAAPLPLQNPLSRWS